MRFVCIFYVWHENCNIFLCPHPCVFVCFFVWLCHSPLICFGLTSCPVSSQVFLPEPYVLPFVRESQPFFSSIGSSPYSTVKSSLPLSAFWCLRNELTRREVLPFWIQFSELHHPSLLWVYICLGMITERSICKTCFAWCHDCLISGGSFSFVSVSTFKMCQLSGTERDRTGLILLHSPGDAGICELNLWFSPLAASTFF